MRIGRLLPWAILSTLAGWAGFAAYKTRAVALELTDPPFYRVPAPERVAATYAELARGGEGDPGGAWSQEEAEDLQLWTLRRARPSKGVVLLLHGFGDDRWGTSPALKWFPELDAAIFTYRRRDDALRAGGPVPPVTFGAREQEEAVAMVHRLEAHGWPRERVFLMGRSLGASVGLLALATLESEGKGPLGGIVWEGAPASSTSFGERLVRGPRDRYWHPLVAPLAGYLGAAWAARRGGYDPSDTDLASRLPSQLQTPALCFLASQDRLADPAVQRWAADRFERVKVVEVETWHLNCATVLGPRYAQAIRTFTEEALNRHR